MRACSPCSSAAGLLRRRAVGRTAFFAVAVFLLTASPATTDDRALPSAEVIRLTMRAREAATLPVKISYSASGKRGESEDFEARYAGTVTRWRDAFVRHEQKNIWQNASNGRMDPASFAMHEVVCFWSGSDFTEFRRPIAPPDMPWTGWRRDLPEGDGLDTPLDVGLFFSWDKTWGQLLSENEFVVVGRRPGAEGPRIEVQLRWALGKDFLPILLSLSEEHGFHPMRIVVMAPADSPHYLDADYLEAEGRRFKPRLIYEVDGLLPLGGSWIPARCRRITRFKREPIATLVLETTDRANATQAVLPEDRAIPSIVHRAVVTNVKSGKKEVVGRAPFELSAEEVADFAEQVERDGPAAATAPLRSAPEWHVLLIAVLAGVLGGSLVWLARRRRRAVKPGGG